MVGKRALPHSSERPGTGAGERPKYGRRRRTDLESGNAHEEQNGHGNGRPRPEMWRFRDAARTALEDKRREDGKVALDFLSPLLPYIS